MRVYPLKQLHPGAQAPVPREDLPQQYADLVHS